VVADSIYYTFDTVSMGPITPSDGGNLSPEAR
jgi:hypothetical protein